MSINQHVRSTFSFIVFILLSISVLAQPVQIDFNIQDYKDSVTYVGYHYGNQKYLLDTLEVRHGHFSLEVENPKQGIYFVYSPDYYLEFIMDGGSFSLSTTKKGGYQEMTIEGSRENELFRDFQMTMGRLQRKQREQITALKEVSGQDSLNMLSSIRQLSDSMDVARQAIIDANEGTFTAGFLKLLEEVEVPTMDSIADENERKVAQYNYYVKHYFEPNQLRDYRLLRTPVIHPKVMKLFDEVLVQHPDTIIYHMDEFMDQVIDDPDSYRYWVVTLFKKYAESKVMGMDAVMVHMIENYYLGGQADWVSEDYEKKLREEVAYVKPNLIGKIAPKIDVVDSLMQPVRLMDIQSPYTLVFIYDPDCGHCKKAVKKLEENDQQLADNGIQVFAVCTTTDVDRWKKFVRNSNPSWIHAIDPTGQSYFRVYYNVRSTPKIYLLDGEKKIIAKKLDVNQFIEFVERREQQTVDSKQ